MGRRTLRVSPEVFVEAIGKALPSDVRIVEQRWEPLSGTDTLASLAVVLESDEWEGDQDVADDEPEATTDADEPAPAEKKPSRGSAR
jgi:hypothetical protein